MIYGEHNNFNIFITNSLYFVYDHFITVGNATLPTTKHPQVCTCSKKTWHHLKHVLQVQCGILNKRAMVIIRKK